MLVVLVASSQKENARTKNSTKRDDKKDKKCWVAHIWGQINLELYSLEKETNESWRHARATIKSQLSLFVIKKKTQGSSKQNIKLLTKVNEKEVF